MSLVGSGARQCCQAASLFPSQYCKAFTNPPNTSTVVSEYRPRLTDFLPRSGV